MNLLKIKTYPVIIVALLVLPVLNGCNASYPEGQLEESVCILAEKEIGKKVECLQKGRTLYTLLSYENLLDKELRLSDETLSIIHSVLLSVNRVALSTDADLEFFVVIVSDNKNGVEIIFTQYVEDLRRWILSNISRNDFFSRSLTDINMHEKGQIVNLETLPEITLPIFLARQVSSRVKKKLEQNIILQILMNVARIDGFFTENYFDYVLTKVDPKSDLVLEKNNEKYPNILETIKDIHQDVVQKYKFDEYNGILIRTDDQILFDNRSKI